MQRIERLDLAKLLGFDTVSNEVSGRVDFRNETIDAKLGAKVGGEPMVACDIAAALASAAAKAD